MHDTYHALASEQVPTVEAIESKIIEIERLAEQHDADAVVDAIETGRTGAVRDAIEAVDDDHLRSELTHWIDEVDELEDQL